MTISPAQASDTAPTPEELLARIRDLQPLLAANSARGEQDRRVVEESITALTAAGAFKLGQPRRHGGNAGTVRRMLDVSAAVGEADGGTAWVVALCNICAWAAGLFPERAQREVWADNPDARVAGALVPTEQTVKVAGGLRVSGRWFYNSGSWHADWAVLGALVPDEQGTVVDQVMMLIPRADLGIEETWFVAGMSSTGSNCLTADDVFVPDHRILSLPAALDGRYPVENPEEALYRAALVPMLVLPLVGPQLGLGRQALRLVESSAATKGIAYTQFTAQADSVAFQLQLAEAALLLDTAHLHAYRAADDIDRAAREGGRLDVLRRARVRADSAWAIEHVTKAIDLLMSAHGAAGFADTSPLQRIWRDSAVAARHAVTLPAVNYEIYGKALLGRDDQITPLI
ncbi:acyl-CoA dehydrogenase family protein [Embleya sp. AB8]|uniref:acyl-CoA dehydrogenase family protein n=1 Tax=Embleya sp. AB8 TaxID=3156304 RepID=UPI003C766845